MILFKSKYYLNNRSCLTSYIRYKSLCYLYKVCYNLDKEYAVNMMNLKRVRSRL